MGRSDTPHLLCGGHPPHIEIPTTDVLPLRVPVSTHPGDGMTDYLIAVCSAGCEAAVVRRCPPEAEFEPVRPAEPFELTHYFGLEVAA